MHFSEKDFISPEQILSDVFPLVGEDGGFKEINKGFYIQQIQRCLEALSFDTFFNERVISEPVPDNLALEIPRGLFNIRQMYLTNSDGCAFGSDSVNVMYKRNFFNNDGSGSGNYVARNKGKFNTNDPFYGGKYRDITGRNKNANLNNYYDNPASKVSEPNEIENAFYYGIQNGLIMFSSTCKRYPYVVIVFNGNITDIGDKPVIPIQFREVCIDWVAEAVLRTKAARNPNMYRYQYEDSKQRLGRNPYNPSGTWNNAEMRAKSMDSKQREDWKLMMSTFVK